MKVRDLPLASIKPYWKNPRKHNDRAIDAVAESIRQYGMNSPIVLDPEGVIIAGHTRYKALQKLGIEKAPTVTVDLPPDKVRAYRLADNATSDLTEWDTDLLMHELQALPDLADLTTFFPDLEWPTDDTEDLQHDRATNEDVTKKRDELNDRFREGTEKRAAGMVDLTCPHCLADFAVSRADVEARTETPEGWTRTTAALPSDAFAVLRQAREDIERRLAADGHKLHQDATLAWGQVLEALAAEYLAG